MQLGQTLSLNAIFASQKAHAAIILSLLLFAASTNTKDIEEGAIKFTCIALLGFWAVPCIIHCDISSATRRTCLIKPAFPLKQAVVKRSCAFMS
jgi:hypothetical protein